MAIRNDRGEEISRQVVGVGALKPGDQRTFTFAVEVFAPAGARVPNTGDTKPETKPETKPVRAPSTAR
jgi:hypothetical protein